MTIFSQRLKELRIENGKTQKEIAAALNTTDDSIFSWEKGRSEPDIETIKKICLLFDVTSDYIIGLENEDGTKKRKTIINTINIIQN